MQSALPHENCRFECQPVDRETEKFHRIGHGRLVWRRRSSALEVFLPRIMAESTRIE